MSKKDRRKASKKQNEPLPGSSESVSRKPGETPSNKDNLSDKKDSSLEHFIYLLILSILYLSIYLYIFDAKLDLNGDNAYYYVLGKALSEGEGYVNIADINKAPNNHYPPGYPFILSIFMHVSDSYVFLKILNGVFLLASLFMFYFLFNYFSKSPKISFITVFFLLLNSHLLLYGTMLMSELSFILISFLCLIFLQRWKPDQNPFKEPAWYLMILTLVFSYYIRSTGLALFGGILLYLILRKYWKAAIFTFVGFTALAFPWIIRGQKLGGSSYIKPLVMINPYRPELGNADLADYFSRFLSNLSRYITREIPSSTLPFFQVNYLEPVRTGEWIIGLIVLGLIIYGLYRLGAKSLIIITYLLATFGILLLWPEVWTGVRFVLPVVPLLLFAGIYGLYGAIQYVFDRFLKSIKFNALIFLVAALGFIGPIKYLHSRAINDYPASWKNYFGIASWFKREGLKEVVVICRKPMLFHLESGTYTSTYTYLNDDKALIEDLKKRQADYVVLDNLGYRQTYEYLLPAINNNQDHFQVVLKLDNPDTYLLKFIPETY